VKKKKIKSTLFFLLLKIAAFFGIYKKMREFFRASPKGCEKIDAKTMYWGLC
jgi:hypothetical protein